MKKPAEPEQPGGGGPDAHDLSIKFTLIFGILAFIPLVLMYHFMSFKSGSDPAPKPPTEAAQLPKVRFRDITAEAGIAFTHQNGATGEKLLPETMGGGCAFFDFDGDGDQDLLLVNSTEWTAPRSTSALYENDGTGKFRDVTAGSGLDVPIYGMGAAVGDYDNDGRTDVFVSAVGGNRLFHNEGGGRFRDVTQAAGVGGSGEAWSTSCAWMDLDNDGDLDLFVCNYVQWSRDIDLQADYRLSGIGRAYGPPMNFAGAFPYLYRNDGGGKFTDIAASAGVQIRNKATGLPMAKSLGVAPVDLDSDGWIDLIVANDTVQNFVFHNERNGTFKEIGASSGLAFDPYGGTRGAMGIDSGRFENGNTLAVSIGNFANEMTALYVQRDPMMFADEAIHQGIGAASQRFLTFGVFFFDYDLDGRLDLLTVNGHIEPEINKVFPGQTYRQPAQLFWNARTKGSSAGFAAVAAEQAGPDLFEPMTGRGAAYADIDGDGDLDVVITQAGGPARLLRNEAPASRRSIRLRLAGVKSNREGIGAWVRARVGGGTFAQQVMPTRGYLSQSELPVTIGLGEAATAEEIQITWPGGVKQTVQGAVPGKLTVVQEPAR